MYQHMKSEIHALAFDARTGEWLEFNEPSRILVATASGDLLTLLDRVEGIVRDEGLWAVGWLSYEASQAIDSDFQPYATTDFPLAWFALYGKPQVREQLTSARAAEVLDWQPSISQQCYSEAVAEILRSIRKGDAYQINFSFRLRAKAPVDPKEMFYSMVQNQAGRYSMYIDAGRFVLSSASPELFFERCGEQLFCRPMKGTAARGSEKSADMQSAAQLVASEKERAENVMIVDMVRNDLSRVASRGSVQVLNVCEVERYPHVWQMVSEVSAHSSASLGQVVQALFPAASITGAPKKSTARIIRQVECSPRNIYTGAMGVISPEGRSWFNVAIRTALIDRCASSVEYGVGSGIVWDSSSECEFRECIAKASAVTQQQQHASLFETILWDPQRGFVLLERHLSRLARSAHYFSFAFDRTAATVELDRLSTLLQKQSLSHRVRLTLSAAGDVRGEVYELRPLPSAYRLSLAQEAVQSSWISLYHKMTDRRVYEEAQPEVTADDVLLWNERGELTESCIANVALEIDGALYTPPISSGLLAGCLREDMLERGELHERILVKSDLLRATRVFLLNSLRGVWEARIVR
jgi:para-aminobenzoate synthetase/4-amino-4-deoxychorismate lyase